MSPETEGNSPDLTTAKDRLGIRDVISRSFKYTPRLVKYALAGTAIGLGMLGLAC